VWEGRFEKFLEMIFGRPHLAFEVVFGSLYAFLAGVAYFFIIAAVAGYYSDTSGLPLLPFLTALGTFPSALMVALVGAARPSLATASALLGTKAAQPPPCQKCVGLRCRVAT
jgi:hypothetical protein